MHNQDEENFFVRNQKETEIIQQNPKFINFLKWCKDQGVIYEDIEFPVSFGAKQPVTGVCAKNNIPANKMIAAIPQKMIITQDSIKKSDIGFIIKKHPEIFDDDLYPSNEFNSFAIFLIYERLKGEKSYYYHYIQIIQESTTLIQWSEKELSHTEDPLITNESIHFTGEIECQITKLHACILNYKEFFPEDQVNKNMLFWGYQSVMTRIFGWSLPSSFMVPFADMFNHSDTKPINHELVHFGIERSNQQIGKYKMHKDKMDMVGLMKDEQLQPKDQKKLAYKNKQIQYIRKHSKYLQDSKEQNIIENLEKQSKQVIKELIYEINEKRLLENSDNNEKDQKYLWDYKFYSTTDSEDNDTDEDTYEGRKLHMNSMREKEIKEIIKLNIGSNALKKPQQKKQKNNQLNFQDIISQKQFKEDIREYYIDKNGYDLYDKLNQSQDSISSDKETKNNKKKTNGIQQDDSESQSSDSEYDWYDNKDRDVYFVLNTQYPYYQGEQIYVCYGQRSNKFLLQWYGFTMMNNKYDSVQFRFNLEMKQSKIDNKLIEHVVFRNFIDKVDTIKGFQEKKDGEKIMLSDLTEIIKLKNSKISQDFITFIRIFLMTHYCGPDLAYVQATLPVSLVYEEFVLKFGLHILIFIRSQYSTSIEEDQYLLESEKLEEKIQVAIIYRIGQKRILDSQIKMFQNMLEFLKLLKISDSIKQAYLEFMKKEDKQIKDLHQIKQYVQQIYYSVKRGFFKSTHIYLQKIREQKLQEQQQLQQNQQTQDQIKQKIQEK